MRTLPRIALLLASISLLACPPTRSGDDDDSSCTTSLTVCGTYGGEPASGGSATIREDPDDEAPLNTPLDSEGCATFDVSPGSWEWRATAADDFCMSAYSPVEVASCQQETVTVELIEWCMDG